MHFARRPLTDCSLSESLDSSPAGRTAKWKAAKLTTAALQILIIGREYYQFAITNNGKIQTIMMTGGF